MSKGEDKIVDLLNQAKIKYIREKTFSDLKHGLFRYDFYLPDFDGARVIIEFNGEQHYHYVKRFYKTPREWRKAQEHDRRKISYALANDIKIYIIPFWEINKITTGRQLFDEKYLARSRWKNDEEVVNSPLYQKD
jgi:hypothetical protein